MLARSIRALTLLAPLIAGTAAQAQEPPHSLGACGGTIVGYDGRQYACERDRRAACQPDGTRCVCVERRDCGGKQDEPY